MVLLMLQEQKELKEEIYKVSLGQVINFAVDGQTQHMLNMKMSKRQDN